MAERSPADVVITIEAEFSLSHEDIWPDGDAPPVITVEDVKAALERHGPKRRVLDEWQLLDSFEVTVTLPNPHWHQDEALLPDQRPAPYQAVEVWR